MSFWWTPNLRGALRRVSTSRGCSRRGHPPARGAAVAAGMRSFGTGEEGRRRQHTASAEPVSMRRSAGRHDLTVAVLCGNLASVRATTRPEASLLLSRRGGA